MRSLEGHDAEGSRSNAYRLYIDARRLWRSKIEWQLTKEESLGILRDVQHAASQGDWGARALMAYFYREGLGPLESNHVLDPDAKKSLETRTPGCGRRPSMGRITISASPSSMAMAVRTRIMELLGLIT